MFGTRGRFDDFATQGDNRGTIRHHSDPIDLSESTGAHQNLVWCRFQHFIHQTLNRLRTHWSSHNAKDQNRVHESFDSVHISVFFVYTYNIQKCIYRIEIEAPSPNLYIQNRSRKSVYMNVVIWEPKYSKIFSVYSLYITFSDRKVPGIASNRFSWTRRCLQVLKTCSNSVWQRSYGRPKTLTMIFPLYPL